MNFRRCIVQTLVSFVIVMSCAIYGVGAECDDVMSSALAIKDAIVSNDVATLTRFFANVIWFVDDRYDKKELVELLSDKNSWLYKDIFGENDSLRTYLANASDVKIIIHEDSEFYLVVFSSPSSSRSMPPNMNLICKGGRLYITNMDEF